MAAGPQTLEEVSWVEILSRIPDEASRRAFLRADPNLQTEAAVQQLFDQLLRIVRIDLRRALRVALATMWLARQLGDRDPARQAG